MGDFDGATLTMTRHDTHRFRFQVKLGGVVQDTTSWQKFWFTVKQSLGSGDAQALFQLTSLPSGGIVEVDATVGLYECTIRPEHTDALENIHHRLPGDIQGEDDEDNVWTLTRVTLEVLPEVTVSTV